MYNARKWMKDVNRISKVGDRLWLIAEDRVLPNRIVMDGNINRMVVWDGYWRMIDLRGEARIIWQTLFRDVFMMTE